MVSKEKRPEDIEQLVAEVEKAVREEMGEDKPPEEVEELVNRVSEALRNAFRGDTRDDVDAVEKDVRLMVRSVVGEDRLGVDMDSLLDRVGRAVRGAFSQWKGAAESVGQSLKDRIRSLVDGVRGTGRESVVMVRVNRESQERMDELVEVGLVGSRSEAAAYLIAEGIKSSEDLFSRISSKIDDVRRAKEELDKILNEKRVPNA